MSTSTIKPLPTLKGVFSVPKMNHRRDFLRENKLNVRELQRVTCKKQANQQQEQQQRQHRQQQQHQQQQQMYTNRRSATQQRLLPPAGGNNRLQQLPVRSISQQRITTSQHAAEPNSRCSSCCGRREKLGAGSCPTIVSVSSKAESCDKQIQTDDINDEEFLHEALKKCSSSEFNCKPNSNTHLYSAQQATNGDALYEPPTTHEVYHNDCYNNAPGHYQQQQPQQQQSSRNYSQEDFNHQHHYHNHAEPVDDMNLNFGNLGIDNNKPQDNLPLSAGSRHTICSKHSQDSLQLKKKSSGSLHKFGSRDEIRLPRYLEREKREKEELKMREQVRDPMCPVGHYALPNDERLAALAAAEKKFKTLVNELNHMPMTTQTLRIRTRKNEIEKELQLLEADIRIFSKLKVYVKQPEEE